MADLTLNPDQLKAVLKSAIMELLQDNKAEFSELLAEMIEDIAMERAIDEGKTTELVSRDTIFQLLEPKTRSSPLERASRKTLVNSVMPTCYKKSERSLKR